MKFKAILVGALVKPFEPLGGKGEPTPWAVMENSKEACRVQAKSVLRKLTDEERKVAYVKIIEVKEETVEEIHAAAERGPDGELRFAITES